MYTYANREKRFLEVRLHKGIRELLGKKISKKEIVHGEVWLVEGEIEGVPLQTDLFEWCASPLIVPCAYYVDDVEGHVYGVAHIYYKGPNPYEIWLQDDVVIMTPLDVMLGGEK